MSYCFAKNIRNRVAVEQPLNRDCQTRTGAYISERRMPISMVKRNKRIVHKFQYRSELIILPEDRHQLNIFYENTRTTDGHSASWAARSFSARAPCSKASSGCVDCATHVRHTNVKWRRRMIDPMRMWHSSVLRIASSIPRWATLKEIGS